MAPGPSASCAITARSGTALCTSSGSGSRRSTFRWSSDEFEKLVLSVGFPSPKSAHDDDPAVAHRASTIGRRDVAVRTTGQVHPSTTTPSRRAGYQRLALLLESMPLSVA